LTERKVNLDDKGIWSIQVEGKRPFEVQGEPWLDPSGSFYLAHVEIVEDRQDELVLENDLLDEATRMSNDIPELVEQWLQLVLATEKSDVGGMSKRMQVRVCFERCYRSMQAPDVDGFSDMKGRVVSWCIIGHWSHARGHW